MHERRSTVAEIYLALLRGINVGGKNKLPMKELAELFVKAGCGEVRTFIQSGNVIFSADSDLAPSLPGALTAGIAERFGLKVPVLLRTTGQLAQVVHNNPFIEEGADQNTLHVVFLADQPTAERIEKLDPNRSPPDLYVVHGQEIYLRLPNGVGNSKLTNAYFDGKLATISTGRNWRTVTTLLGLMGG
jgi:uncharacterized protein (DUF1697 family)